MIYVKLVKVTNRIIDCFHGEGWENWSRWFLQKDGFASLVGGIDPPKEVKKQIFINLHHKKGTN